MTDAQMSSPRTHSLPHPPPLPQDSLTNPNCRPPSLSSQPPPLHNPFHYASQTPSQADNFHWSLPILNPLTPPALSVAPCRNPSPFQTPSAHPSPQWSLLSPSTLPLQLIIILCSALAPHTSPWSLQCGPRPLSSSSPQTSYRGLEVQATFPPLPGLQPLSDHPRGGPTSPSSPSSPSPHLHPPASLLLPDLPQPLTAPLTPLSPQFTRTSPVPDHTANKA